ncbi:amino acid ABC transporter permease [Amylolactobacillus amylotrophicus DSM 20534]|uniref:Cysteine ABC transporter permease n=3 Tax=Amylolactobacillus TaxID=2767876 RepID=A0A1L6XCX4_9LACO|nr:MULTISPECIES: amino acid ABC transporter permease [Amylolactobacillus]APT18830.1 cysteine ABC transporter permease [Amylolactobacillus amylophilus DSM 20533 = JCM 1125]KRK37151.1 amino acid ABC transporter permease [Amylolactobacillus amylotrophicus DSM 20534]KRM43468.1 amino acid ABC transporter permease [Amylolactobacillus amylophilus DSM 20533 = JCM 1125]GED80817.1 cysteine ABC transporter permease [Amylolactobacillus amylophilus]
MKNIVFDSILPLLESAVMVTIPLTIIAFIFGLIIAILTAVVRLSHVKVIKQLFGLYVWIFRGTPLLVQLFIIYFGLPSVGIRLDAWTASVIALSLNTGAYASEAIRSAILSIDVGQWDAATSLGMSRWMVLRRIIAPQALRVALPPLSNSLISLVKDTSLASSITLLEMFMTSQRIAARTFEPLLMYSVVALYYLVLSTLLTFLQQYLEKHASRFIREE